MRLAGAHHSFQCIWQQRGRVVVNDQVHRSDALRSILPACNARSGFHLDSTPYKILSVAASMAKVLQLFVLPVSGSHRSAGRDQTFWSACSLLWLSLVGAGYLVGGLLRSSARRISSLKISSPCATVSTAGPIKTLRF